MKYHVIEKDAEDPIGFIHKNGYDTKEEAEIRANGVKAILSEEYYDVFVAEMED